MNRSKLRMSAISGIVTLALLASGAALAAPTAQVVAGQTTVDLDAGFVDALGSLGIQPAPVAPGALVGGQLSYPIPGGALDLDLASLKGDVFHVGGLQLSKMGTEVGLLNFIISTTGAPTLTGIVTLGGSVVDRLPLFDLDLGSAGVDVMANTVTISNVGVFLTQGAADTLSAVFEVNIPGGLRVGTATVVAQAAPGQDGGDDEDSDDDESADGGDDEDEDDDGGWRSRMRQRFNN